MSKILVTGATGQLGSSLINKLLEKVSPGEITALVRDENKAEALKNKGVQIVVGNYADYASLVKAFKGIDKLYFISSSEMMNRIEQHENVVQAAVEAKVGHIFYTSVQRKSEDGSSPSAIITNDHVKTDEIIKQSELTYTILRHGLYSDILPMFIGDKVIETGTIFLPAADGKAAFASRKDMAEAGAILLTTNGHENKTYEISGVDSLSFHDIAGILSELSANSIQYISPSPEQYVDQLRSYDVPEQMIQGASNLCVGIAQAEFDFPSNDLQNILGRKPETVKEFLKVAYGL
ncbi:SDR family oxidoreductase [Pedobacter sp. WC2423]|uniref:SDR family oxidoreductase n=1 Tax=Pedobacter sp. WC2423 TaxID=3234142 RepID=UPI0034674638